MGDCLFRFYGFHLLVHKIMTTPATFWFSLLVESLLIIHSLLIIFLDEREIRIPV